VLPWFPVRMLASAIPMLSVIVPVDAAQPPRRRVSAQTSEW
jgi:hypothetical protein